MATAPDPGAAPEWRLRPMRATDLARVVALERASYAFPWNERIFDDCLRVGYHCLVVETAAGLGGYAVLSTGAGEAHLLNLCVEQALRRGGIGRELLYAALERAQNVGVRDVFLEVRRSNTAAMALYQVFGFERIGVRRGYYQAHEGREDAIVYRLELGALRPRPGRGPLQSRAP
ncbi:MAG: ribosomal-protein-alanine N-acetyltransferase [Gammaproteobacteria bacterium]|nr:ribosomal-protein-alanine N-acetyltransferase [Gammaproteobacteria bacterium]